VSRLWSYGSLNRWRKELTKLPRLSTEVLLRSLSSLLTQLLLRLSYTYLSSVKTRTSPTYLWAPRKNSARLAVPAEMSLLLQLLRMLTPSKTRRLTLLKTSASVSSSTLEDICLNLVFSFWELENKLAKQMSPIL